MSDRSERLPVELWSHIFSYLRRPLPSSGPETEWDQLHQHDLASLMRVNQVGLGLPHSTKSFDSPYQVFGSAASPRPLPRSRRRQPSILPNGDISDRPRRPLAVQALAQDQAPLLDPSSTPGASSFPSVCSFQRHPGYRRLGHRKQTRGVLGPQRSSAQPSAPKVHQKRRRQRRCCRLRSFSLCIPPARIRIGCSMG